MANTYWCRHCDKNKAEKQFLDNEEIEGFKSWCQDCRNVQNQD